MTRILVAGIGNVFLGDDGFGVAVAHRLLARPQLPEVRVLDIGLRGIDLTYALLDEPEGVVLVDALPRGRAPGTLYVFEPDLDEVPPADSGLVEAHALHPEQVLQTARSLGAQLGIVRIVGCEPERLGGASEAPWPLERRHSPEDPSHDPQRFTDLSPAVSRAVDDAVKLVEDVIAELSREFASHPHRARRPASEVLRHA